MCLRSFDGETPLLDCREIVLAGADSPTPEKAFEFGKEAMVALIVGSTRLGVGIDLKDNNLPRLNDAEMRNVGYSLDVEEIKNEKTAAQLRENGITEGTIHYVFDNGEITVFDRNKETLIVKSKIYDTDHKRTGFAVSTCTAEMLLDEVIAAYDLNVSLTDKQRLAFDLYHASQFESLSKVRFLTLMIAVESLLEYECQPAEVVKHVIFLINTTNSSSLRKEQKDSLINRLEWLVQESIAKTGRKLAKNRLYLRKYDNKKATDFFDSCYKIRSQIVHNGKADDEEAPSRLISELDRFVADLLLLGVRPNYQTRRTDAIMAQV